MHLRHSTRIRVLWLVMGGLLLLAAALGHVRAQETADSPPPLRVSGVDTGAFPRVDLYLAAADPLAPLPAAAGEVRVLDDGEAAEDAAAAVVPVGVDLIFVIDANDTITTLDNDAELSRLEKARRSVMDFATTYMNAEGLDRVSVLVPGGVGENGRFLLQDAATPSAVVEGLLAYAPEEFGETPLNAMLTQAVEHAARQRAASARAGLARYQAVLLFSDGARLDEQLAFDELTAAAQAVELPLFGAILGARADPDEIANVTQLTDPTGGAYLHMPDEAALAPFYALWQQQGRQLRVSFTSAQRSSGAYPLAVTVGGQQIVTTYAVTLAAPVVSLLLEPGAVVRAGAAADTPLAELAPAELAVPVAVAWPDGQLRALAELELRVNGEARVTLAEPAADAAGGLLLEWDLRDARAGEYALTVRVTDALGLTASSEPVIVTVVEERPALPTPTPAPTATAVPAAAVLVETAVDNQPLVGLALGLLGGLGVLLLVQRRRRGRGTQGVDLNAELADLIVTPEPAAAVPESGPVASAMVGMLEWPDGARAAVPLTAETTTVGREADADVAIDDPSVSRLHARIKRSDGRYWLYDEGSAEGTAVDFERLGLGPRLLQDGSRIQFGRVRCVFRLRPAGED